MIDHNAVSEAIIELSTKLDAIAGLRTILREEDSELDRHFDAILSASDHIEQFLATEKQILDDAAALFSLMHGNDPATINDRNAHIPHVQQRNEFVDDLYEQLDFEIGTTSETALFDRMNTLNRSLKTTFNFDLGEVGENAGQRTDLGGVDDPLDRGN